jgi:hypothetical protein
MPDNAEMPELSDTEIAALKFMAEKPLQIDPFSAPPNIEEVAAMLDGLARRGLCRRALQGITRVYSITPEGKAAVSQSKPSESNDERP